MTTRPSAATRVVMEIIGPAGAGKSAVAAWLIAHAPGIRIVPHANARRDMASFLGAAARLGPMIVDSMMRDPAFTRRHFRHLVRLETLRSRLVATTSAGARAALFDEGPLYSLARLRAFWPARLTGSRLDDRLARTLREWAPGIDLVIALDAPNPVLVHRIGVRAKSHRMRGRDDQTAFAFLDAYRAAYASMLADVTACSAARTLSIDTGTTSVTETGARILEAIHDQAAPNESGEMSETTGETAPAIAGV